MSEPTELDRLRFVVREMANGLDWVPTDDKEISCVVCGEPGANVETRIRTRSHIVWMGLHSECLR